MKNIIKKLKSNKGFTMQDLVIAMSVLVIFAGAIGAIFIAIYKVQSRTALDEAATLYGIQIMEYVDRVAYSDVKSSEETKEFENKCRTNFNIPEGLTIKIEASEENSSKTIKKVIVTLSYEFSGETQNLVLEKFKVKES